MSRFHGRHLLGSYLDCDPDALADSEGIRALMRAAAEAAGATIVGSVHHLFPPDGITVLLLLSESHASIHTYPEHGSCFVDLFTCGSSCRPEEFDRLLRDFLRP